MSQILRAVVAAIAGAVLAAVVATAFEGTPRAVLWTAGGVALLCVAVEALLERKLMSNRRKLKGPRQPAQEEGPPQEPRTGIRIIGGRNVHTRGNTITGLDRGIEDEDGEGNTHSRNQIN